MRYKNPLLVVKDLKVSITFYEKIFGLKIEDDFGANVVFSCGIALQTEESWVGFIHRDKCNLLYGSNVSELYFEEEDFDNFIKKISIYNLNLVHKVKEHSWGQRVIRIYDPDNHIIEVGECMKSVVNRFISEGMSTEEISTRMDVTVKYINRLIK